MIRLDTLLYLGLVFCCAVAQVNGGCYIPDIIRNAWFSWENGKNTYTNIDAETMTNRGHCVATANKNPLDHFFVFQNSKCYYCIHLIIRTTNVLEKMETTCIDLPKGVEPSVENVCRSLPRHQQFVTLFAENFSPVNCRSSLEGVWQFAYRNDFTSTGVCDHPDAQIRSCQTAGTQFLITNQKFNITYKKCSSMATSEDKMVEYSCLGDWLVDKNHFFAVVNTKESRKQEKYRCFLKNRDDDLYIGVSITAECNTLRTVDKSPERLSIRPVKAEVVEPGCRLPTNMSGLWINSANINADVVINETHITETLHPDEGRYRHTIYVCKEQRDTRFMMARLTVDGCQKDYVCFDFVPRHHEIIRYRRGRAIITDDFSTVCSWVQFRNKENWSYDLYLRRDPVAVRCPVAGKFSFEQRGEIPFETRILGGVTLSPRHDTNCSLKTSDFSVCGAEQKEITIDETYCLTVDHLGRPKDIYTEPDYRMKCIGFWKENLKSYLITYDERDPFNVYRCWIYQRADLDRILMSQSLGPFCNLEQTVYSSNGTEGAAVAIAMKEYERERDQCPMYFDDGSDPWADRMSTITVFRFNKSGAGEIAPSFILHTLVVTTIVTIFLMH